MRSTTIACFLYAILQTSFAVRFDVDHALSEKHVNVKLLLTRHALSCANAVKAFGSSWGSRTLSHTINDPMLSGCGEARSRSASSQVKAELGDTPIDMVLSSSMLRAMETAALQYPDHSITPIPYISEKGFTPDNKPYPTEKQEEKIVDANISSFSMERFDMKWMDDLRFSEARGTPSWSEFENFMANEFLPSLPEPLQSKSDLTLAVVSHSHFLSHAEPVAKLCKDFYNKKPRNNQVLALDFMFSEIKGESVNLRHFEIYPNATCRNVYPGEEVPKYLCEDDFGSECHATVSRMGSKPSMSYKESILEDLMQRRAAYENEQKGKMSSLYNRWYSTNDAEQIDALNQKIELVTSASCCVA